MWRWVGSLHESESTAEWERRCGHTSLMTLGEGEDGCGQHEAEGTRCQVERCRIECQVERCRIECRVEKCRVEMSMVEGYKVAR